jgi:hypothetical protein
LLLARIYIGKYSALSEIFSTRGPYTLADLGYDALVIALPMVIAAFASLLGSRSLFPDETDFRVLLSCRSRGGSCSFRNCSASCSLWTCSSSLRIRR